MPEEYTNYTDRDLMVITAERTRQHGEALSAYQQRTDEALRDIRADVKDIQKEVNDLKESRAGTTTGTKVAVGVAMAVPSLGSFILWLVTVAR